MLSRCLTWASVACCLLTLASFGMFARDQFAGVSLNAQQQLTADTGQGPAPVAASHAPGQPRRAIDDAARALTSPFRSLFTGQSQWIAHGGSTLLALLTYGLGLGFLARFSRGAPRQRPARR